MHGTIIWRTTRAGMKQTRFVTPGVTQKQNLISHDEQMIFKCFILLVRPEGLEPSTPCLEGRCSIHLSYGRIRT